MILDTKHFRSDKNNFKNSIKIINVYQYKFEIHFEMRFLGVIIKEPIQSTLGI